MNEGKFHNIDSTGEDGAVRSVRVPDRARRELLAAEATDTLLTRLIGPQPVMDAACAAARTASPETSSAELIAAWNAHTDALIGLIGDIVIDGTTAVEAVRRLLYEE